MTIRKLAFWAVVALAAWTILHGEAPKQVRHLVETVVPRDTPARMVIERADGRTEIVWTKDDRFRRSR